MDLADQQWQIVETILPPDRVRAVIKDTVVVERGDVARAKREPDLFFECQERLGLDLIVTR